MLVLVKREEDLTEQDFANHPVWIYADVERLLVTPRLKGGPAPVLSLVSTVFTAADGTRYRGFGITTKGNVIGHTLFAQGAQVRLHFRTVPAEEDLRRSYALLDTTPSRFFPVKFAAVPPLMYKSIWDEVTSFSFQAADGSIQEVQ